MADRLASVIEPTAMARKRFFGCRADVASGVPKAGRKNPTVEAICATSPCRVRLEVADIILLMISLMRWHEHCNMHSLKKKIAYETKPIYRERPPRETNSPTISVNRLELSCRWISQF